MTLAEVGRIFRHWRRAPPTHRLMAAFVGFKPPPEEPAKPADPNDPSGIGGLLKRFPSGIVPISGL